MCSLTTSALLVSILLIGGSHAHPARGKPWRRGGGPNQVEEVRHHATPTPFPETMYSEEELVPSLEEENFLEEEEEHAQQEAAGEEEEEEEEPIEFLTDDNQEQLQDDTMAAVVDPHNPQGEDMIRARARAQLRFIDVMLIALGPEFQKKLPSVSNTNTLATVPTPIHIASDPCPSTYMRCTSQTFFPSCEVPRNTDEEVWAQRFNLFFNTVSELDNDNEVINSTLRLYKNEIVPLKNPSLINVEVYSYVRSLNKRRDRHSFISKTKVLSNFTGWVSVNVKEMARKWKIRRNHGLLVRVTDELNQPYNARALFVNMDCDTGLQPPLPLGVRIDEEGEKYPALSIRQGIVDIGMPEESEDYVSTFSSVPTVSTPWYRTDIPEGDDMVADDPSLVREENVDEEYEEYIPRVMTSREQTSESPRHARIHSDRHLHPSHIHSEEQLRPADRMPSFEPSLTRHRERTMAFQHAVSAEDQRSHRHRSSKELRRQRRKHQQQQQQQQQQHHHHHHHQSQQHHHDATQPSVSHVSHNPSRRTDSRRIHPTPEVDSY